MYRLKYDVTKMNDTRYVSYSQSIDTTDISLYNTEPYLRYRPYHEKLTEKCRQY